MVDRKLAEVNTWLVRPWTLRWVKRKDPELVKAFSRTATRLTALRGHLAEPPAAAPYDAIRAVVARVDAGAGREGAWDTAEELQGLLLRMMSADALDAAVVAEQENAARATPTWAQLFGAEDQAQVMSRREKDPEGWTRVATERLLRLHEARFDLWRHVRARTQLRNNYLFSAVALLAVSLSASVVMCTLGPSWFSSGTSSMLTAMATGALGSLLSGTIKLRDRAMGIQQLRSFWPALIGQTFVGATAAMFVYLVLGCGLIRFGSLAPDGLTWQHLAIFGFVAGFSEPFFLGVVARLAGSSPAASADSSGSQTPSGAPPPEATTPGEATSE